MRNPALQALSQPETEADPPHELLRDDARKLITEAVQAELANLLEEYGGEQLEDGRQAVVRNGYLPERTVQTGVGDVSVQVPKVRDRSGPGYDSTESCCVPI